MKNINRLRDEMRNSNDNLGWCRAFRFEGGEAMAVNEGDCVSILVDGAETISPTPEQIASFARRVNKDYRDYSGYTDVQIALDAIYTELACRDCPWFGECQAMDEILDD